MKAYLVQFDGQDRIVEAPGFAAAILAWKCAMLEEHGAEWDGDEEPDSVSPISDEEVIRVPDGREWCENAARCGNTATCHDNEGVGLCAGCMTELLDAEEAKSQRAKKEKAPL